MSKRSPFVASALALAVSSAFAQSTTETTNPLYQLASLDPVVVSASRYEEPRSTASTVVDVISREQIEAGGSINISEFLESISGVSLVRSYGRLGVDASVDVGYLGEGGVFNTLILVDGQRINAFDSSGVRFVQVPISSIDRVEIRKANGGVLFGDRAQGGVINIITRNDEVKQVELSRGSFGYEKVDAYLGFGSKESFGSISALKTKSDGYRNSSSVDQESARIGVGARNTSFGDIQINLRTYDETAQLPSFLTIAEFKSDPRKIGAYPGRADRSGNSVSISQRNLKDGRNGWTSDFFWSETKGVSSDAYGSTNIRNTRVSLSPEYHSVFGRHRLLLGSEIYRVEANTDGGKQVAQDSGSIYAQDSYSLAPTLVLDYGVRRHYVQNDFKVNTASAPSSSDDAKNAYTVGTRILVDPNTTFRIGGLTGYRFANADELYFWRWSPYRLVEINPNLKPMQSKELYAEMSHRYATGHVSLHFRHVATRDEIGFTTNCSVPSGGTADCNANLYNTARNLFSFGWHHRIDKDVQIGLALDLIDSEIKSGTNTGKRVPLTPTKALRLTAERQFHGFKLLASSNFRDSMYAAADPSNSQQTIPSRAVFDVGVKAQPTKGWTVSGWVRNVFDRSYYDYAAWDGWSTLGVYPADSRSVDITVKYDF